MNNFDRAFRIGSLVLLVLFLLKAKGCQKQGDTGEATERAATLVAKPDVKAAVVVKTGSVVVARKGKKPRAVYVPPEGRVEAVVTTAGELRVETFDAGFSFSLGLAPVVNTEGVGRVGLVSKVAYKGRWGLEVGLLFGKRPFLVPGAGVSFQPPWRFRNTAAILGYDVRQTIFMGLLVRF